MLCDGLLLQKTLVRAPKGPGSWELPGERAEVRCSWRGEVEATGFVFRGEAPFRYSRADASLLRVWRELKMKRGEVTELKVAPELAYGSGGEPELGVPPDASLLLRVAMGDWNDVEDVSPGRDGSALKVVEIHPRSTRTPPEIHPRSTRDPPGIHAPGSRSSFTPPGGRVSRRGVAAAHAAVRLHPLARG